ncbi:cystatin-A-like [Gigantopelta aegis]|uniref:cystatin-A-like n=1 Tax=Gigantopelta aegis TaxID=1735272 RepID=UPI001B888E1E|nr:cystatin-A-like [Gigantopelta aegis]
MAVLCGGATPMKEATEEVQEICNKIRAELEEKVGKTFSDFKATHFSSQVVAGINYFVKVSIGDAKYLHVKIYKPLPRQGEASVTDYQLDKTADEPIGYF